MFTATDGLSARRRHQVVRRDQQLHRQHRISAMSSGAGRKSKTSENDERAQRPISSSVSTLEWPCVVPPAASELQAGA